MWRKKVDNSIFSSGHIVIPKAYVKQWRLEVLFRDNGKNAETWPIEVQFGTKIYNGKVRIMPIERSDFDLLFKKIYTKKLKSDYLYELFNKFLGDGALDKYQDLGEEDWINNFRENLS